MNFYKAILDVRDHLLEAKNPTEVIDRIEDCNHMLDELENQEQILVINKEEAQALKDFFLTCGYISYEFHSEVHDFCKKLDNFLKC